MNLKNYLLILKAVLMSVFFSAITFNASAQSCTSPPNCLANPHLTSGTAGYLNPGSVTMNGWYRSHGEAEIGLGNGYSGLNRLEMSSVGGGGEGVYACYNFKKNRTYKVCLWVMYDNASTTGGSLVVKAATGLTESTWPIGSGGFNLPSPSAQTIYNNGFTTTTWTLITVTYTPGNDYTQLWIYPYNTTPLPSTYKLYISKVSVFEIPQPFGVSAPCEGDIVLDGSSFGCGITDWYDPTGVYLGTGTVIIRDALPSMAGDYMLTLRSGDCSADIPVQVYVSECNCETVIPDFDAETSTNPVVFTETTSGPGTSVGWYWDFGDGSTSNAPNPSHGYTTTGNYTVCLTIIRKVGDQTCCVNICKNVEVGVPWEDFTAPIGFTANQLNLPGNVIQFSKAIPATNTITEYYWNFGDGQISAQQNPAHIYAEPGIYHTCLVTKDFSYDANGNLLEQEQKYCENVEVKDKMVVHNQQIKIIPNPATKQAMVHAGSITNASVVLYNTAGVHVATAKMAEKGKYLFDLQGLPTGIYIVKVKSGNDTYSLKLVKE